jgi:vacuolar-type H+-ATPase subunit C/Vma6
LAPKDFYNAEYLLRQCYKALPDLPLVEGEVPLERIKKGLDGAYNLLPSYLVAPIKEASALFERESASGVEISTVFTRALYAHLADVCKSRRVRGYVVWQIDAKNISVALRSATRADLERMWIEGGKVSFDSLLLLQKGERTSLDRRFIGTEYVDVVRAALDAKEKGLPLIAYENAVDSAFLRSLYPERYSSEGVAPFLLYFGYVSNDIANVRVVLAGKLAKADKESIKARLRVCYGE